MSTRPKLSNRRLRDAERIVHIVAGFVLLLFVYTATSDAAWLDALVRWIAFPILVGSGFAMWQLPRVRRWWAGYRSSQAAPTR